MGSFFEALGGFLVSNPASSGTISHALSRRGVSSSLDEDDLALLERLLCERLRDLELDRLLLLGERVGLLRERVRDRDRLLECPGLGDLRLRTGEGDLEGILEGGLAGLGLGDFPRGGMLAKAKATACDIIASRSLCEYAFSFGVGVFPPFLEDLAGYFALAFPFFEGGGMSAGVDPEAIAGAGMAPGTAGGARAPFRRVPTILGWGSSEFS
jgi:hypothetical protein